MNIVKKLCPQERYNIKCPYLREPDRIVVHNTANDAPAANEINYMINRPEEVSFHFAADDTGVALLLDFYEGDSKALEQAFRAVGQAE